MLDLNPGTLAWISVPGNLSLDRTNADTVLHALSQHNGLERVAEAIRLYQEMTCAPMNWGKPGKGNLTITTD